MRLGLHLFSSHGPADRSVHPPPRNFIPLSLPPHAAPLQPVFSSFSHLRVPPRPPRLRGKSSFSPSTLNPQLLSPPPHAPAGIPTAPSGRTPETPAGNFRPKQTRDLSPPPPAPSRPPVSGWPPPSVPRASTSSVAGRCRAGTPHADTAPSIPIRNKAHRSDSHTQAPSAANTAPPSAKA